MSSLLAMTELPEIRRFFHMDKLYAERAALARELAQIYWKIEYERSRVTLLLHEIARKKKGKKRPRY